MGAGAAAGPWQPHSAVCPAGQGPQATAGAHGRREAARPPPSGGSLAGGHMWDALRCIWPFAFGFLSQISKCFARLIGFSRTALHALHVIFSVIFLVVFACAREQPRRTKGHERTRRQFGGAAEGGSGGAVAAAAVAAAAAASAAAAAAASQHEPEARARRQQPCCREQQQQQQQRRQQLQQQQQRRRPQRAACAEDAPSCGTRAWSGHRSQPACGRTAAYLPEPERGGMDHQAPPRGTQARRETAESHRRPSQQPTQPCVTAAASSAEARLLPSSRLAAAAASLRPNGCCDPQACSGRQQRGGAGAHPAQQARPCRPCTA